MTPQEAFKCYLLEKGWKTSLNNNYLLDSNTWLSIYPLEDHAVIYDAVGEGPKRIPYSDPSLLDFVDALK